MGDWDWNTPAVLYGEWWLFLGAVALVVIAGFAGYQFGAARERKYWEKHYQHEWLEKYGNQPPAV